MAEDGLLSQIQELTTEEHFRTQSATSRRFKPYSFTMGLRKTMEYVEPEEIQELVANRNFGLYVEMIPGVSESVVSDYVEGKNTHGRDFEVDYDRTHNGPFSWSDVKGLLGKQSTVYDVPVRHLVIRFDDEEFVDDWASYIENAIDATEVLTDWIETPFYAVLKSSSPGESDALNGIHRLHEDFYYDPEAEQEKEGLPCPPVTLDLEAIWSHRAFVRDDEPVQTNWVGDKDWTPRMIEHALMNFFAPDSQYSGRLFNSSLAGDWRGLFALEATDTKVYQWEGGEEWEQQPDIEPEV